ncbi:hypothetical protein H9L12_07780 [Sphingomonas rhizophila]|uniref:LysM peptidoglycan-binding domain-containing protein n=1 Tax=Sphingomonas rhizophila TaxID=2071607 RepID=A0A7G9S8T4_9SPHN|nr:hypothetical protein [Sphingomonas rhizophila]QNN64259.1 hypothetical protein H9L12_07780 [Sphingomonas rhizophila]
MRKTLSLMLAAAAGLSAIPAAAADNNGLVVIDLTNADVLNNLAQNLKVNVSDISALNNVSVPIGLAAAICDVNANVLAAQKKTGTPTCTAKNSTSALQSAVQKKLGTVSQ